MQRIVYTNSEGGISICTPVVSRDDPEGFTDDDALKRALAKDIPADATNVHVVEFTDLPQDRYFRNAWSTDGKAVSVDMDKARAIHKDRLRSMRAPKLAALDVDYDKADEAGDAAAKKAVADKKQALRDVTKDAAIAAATTPDELKAVIPEALA
jgi:hypothetical protein